jgi:hypothetical protein
MTEFSFDTIVRNPAAFAENRLPAHSDHTAFRNEAELAAGESSLNALRQGLLLPSFLQAGLTGKRSKCRKFLFIIILPLRLPLMLNL